MNPPVLCIYKHGFSLLVWVTDLDMRRLIWMWVWQEHIVWMVCWCVCQLYVSVCASMHSCSSTLKRSLRCTHTHRQTHSWDLLLPCESLTYFLSFSRSFFVLAATPSFFCVILSIAAIITFHLSRGGDVVVVQLCSWRSALSYDVDQAKCSTVVCFLYFRHKKGIPDKSKHGDWLIPAQEGANILTMSICVKQLKWLGCCKAVLHTKGHDPVPTTVYTVQYCVSYIFDITRISYINDCQWPVMLWPLLWLNITGWLRASYPGLSRMWWRRRECSHCRRTQRVKLKVRHLAEYL